MSAIDHTLIGNVLVDRVPQIVEDVIVKRSTVVNLLRSKYRTPIDDPKGPRWQVKTTGHSTAGTFAEDGPYPSASRAEYTTASLGWARYAATVKFTRQALLELSMGNDLSRIAGYINAQIVDAVNDMVDEMESDALSNDPTTGDANGLAGFSAIFSDTNSYAAIDRSTQTLWRAYENTTGGTPTMAICDDLHDTLLETREGRFSAYLASIARARDIASITTGGVTTFERAVGAGEELTATLGFAGMDRLKPWALVNGRPLVAIPNLSSSVLYATDMDGLFWQELQDLQIGPLQDVQNSPNVIATATMYCQMGHRNPFRGCAFASSLT